MALQLDLRHYETVAAIVELGSMTAAARELSTTQSALSHRLAEAERRLGVQLFERSAQRRLRPTRAGLAVHQTASRALADLDRCEAAIRSETPGITSIVRIAVGSYDCYHWYPMFLDRVRHEHPTVELELVVVGDTPSEALGANTADLVLAPSWPSGPIECQPGFADELVLVTGPEHRLADRDFVEADEMAELTYLTYNPSPAPGFEYDRFIRPAQVYPLVVTVVPSTSAISELVAAGVGVSILSRWAMAPMIDGGRLVAIGCGADGLELDWHIALRSQEPADSPVRLIADALRRHVAPSVTS
ncbi:MAG: LysR family transcriptional regulator [Acidimicrobiales bacterium]